MIAEPTQRYKNLQAEIIKNKNGKNIFRLKFQMKFIHKVGTCDRRLAEVTQRGAKNSSPATFTYVAPVSNIPVPYLLLPNGYRL